MNSESKRLTEAWGLKAAAELTSMVAIASFMVGINLVYIDYSKE